MNNIAIVSLADGLSFDICKSISKHLDLNYIDFNDYVSYELSALLEPEKGFDIEFVKKIEAKAVKNLCGFLKSCISIPRRIITDRLLGPIVRDDCLTVFIRLGVDELKKFDRTSVEQLMVKEYNKMLEGCSNIVVDAEKMDMKNLHKEVIAKIDDYFS